MESLAPTEGGVPPDRRIGPHLYAAPAAQFVLRRLCDYPAHGTALVEELATTVEVQGSPSAAQLELDLHWGAEAARPDITDVGRCSAADVQATRRLLKAITEVMDGRRSLAQFGNRLHPAAYGTLQAIARRANSATYTTRLCSLHTFQPAEGAIEACATIQQGKRARALAARLQHSRIGWMCVRLGIL